MTGVYTEYTLKALIKPHIVDLLLKIEEHTVSTISNLTRGIRNLSTNFKRLELDAKFCQWLQTPMLEKCEEIPKGVQIIGMPKAIIHSGLSKTVRKILEHIGANRIMRRPQQKKLSYSSETSARKNFKQVRKGQEVWKIFKSNWFRFSGRDMPVHKSHLVS